MGVPKIDGCNTQEQTTWGLVRVGQKQLNIDGLFSYVDLPDTEHGAKAYVMDTGIYRENVEFESADGSGVRALFGADFTTSSPPKTDLNGHGTHCAGSIMGNLHGMVKDGIAVDVRVLDASGSGSYAGIIAGIDFVAGDAKGERAVGSMSLGGCWEQCHGLVPLLPGFGGEGHHSHVLGQLGRDVLLLQLRQLLGHHRARRRDHLGLDRLAVLREHDLGYLHVRAPRGGRRFASGGAR